MLDAKQLYSLIRSKTSSKNFLIAYSGGLDSHVLLHLMAEICKTSDFTMRAITIHHGLQKEADDWAIHCQNICENLTTPFQEYRLNLSLNTGESIEALARKGRYQALKEVLKPNEVLLTGHHQDDQAETLLLQLFRGAGVDGLASMPLITSFGVEQHARPLLSCSRESLAAYAHQHHLKYVEDPSNKDERFDRNFLRKTIIPRLQKRWLSINAVLFRVAEHQAETKSLLDEFAQADLDLLTGNLTGENDKNKISITALFKLSKQRQKHVVRFWIKQQGFLAPSQKKLQHLFADVLHAQQDAMPLLSWQGVEIRRYQDHLFIMPPLREHDQSQVIDWDIASPLKIPEIGIHLTAKNLKGLTRNLQDGIVTVRFRQGGEKVNLAERGGRISLKNLFQEANIPPWLRSRVALVYLDDELVYVCFESEIK